MYKVPEFIPKVYLIHRDGRRWKFNNITEAANELWTAGYLGRYREAPLFDSHFRQARPLARLYEYIDDTVGSEIYYDYIVRDEVGEVLTPNDLKEARTKSREYNWLYRRDAQADTADKFFRCAPIPYTGKKGWRSGYRHVRTRSEIRENEFLKYDEDAIEYDIKPRKRRVQDLPTLWMIFGATIIALKTGSATASTSGRKSHKYKDGITREIK